MSNLRRVVRWSGDPGARVAVFAAVALMVAAVLFPSPGRADSLLSSRLKPLRTMPYGTPDEILRLLVDPELSLGMTLGSAGGVESNVLLYDLKTLRRIQNTPVPFPPGQAHALRGVVDVSHHRVLFAPDVSNLNAIGCSTGPLEETGVLIYSFVSRGWKTMEMPCVGSQPDQPRGPGVDQFGTRGLSYDATNNKVYAIGTPLADFVPRFLFALNDRNGQTLLLRQISADSLHIDWEIDLRQAGCDLIVNNANQFGANSSNVGAFVQRVGDSVLTYCYGPAQNGFSGRQGFALVIPLHDGKPLPAASGTNATSGNVVIRAIPSLPEQLVPMVDPVSGRMLLVTAGPVNGNAVWVLDPSTERFLGIIASGVIKTLDDAASNYAAFDEMRGRLYYLSTAGLLIADVRHTPLPAGVSFDVGIRNSPPDGPFMGVAPKLRRIFIPDRKLHAYRVFEDNVPEPPVPEAARPDDGTADIAEAEGKTGSNFSAAASAYGLHLLSTGGIPRIADNRDLACALQVDAVNQPRDQIGLHRCIAHALLSAGDREIFLAQTRGDVGSQTGALASAAGAAFSSADTADDSDFKRLGNCFVDAQDLAKRTDVWKALPDDVKAALDEGFRSGCSSLIGIMAAQDAPQATAVAVDQLSEGLATMLSERGVPKTATTLFSSTIHDVAASAPPTGAKLDFDPRQGTRGEDARGRPIRGSHCEDFGDGSAHDAQTPGTDGIPWSVFSSSSTMCEASGAAVTGAAAAAGFALKETSEPLLAVARSSSSINTELTPEGIKTTVKATASGVVIGEFSIGRIATEAVTVAHGRRGTTHATFSRVIADVHGPGINCAVIGDDSRGNGCTWSKFVASMNEQLGRFTRVSASLPGVEATEHGYQAVVSKDPAERNSDHTMNDDDTHEWPGLKIVFYNDGQFGRSRLVVSLAAVHAESHYGIFKLEEGGPPTCAPCLGGGGSPGSQIIQYITNQRGSGPGQSITRYVVLPVRAIAEGLQLLVNNPREAGILAILLSLLASPVYLALKRRAFTRGLPG